MDFLGFSKERKEKRDVDQKGTGFPQNFWSASLKKVGFGLSALLRAEVL